jgi:hypothetical protein
MSLPIRCRWSSACLQNDLPVSVLYAGAAALSVLFVLLVAVIGASFRRKASARVV